MVRPLSADEAKRLLKAAQGDPLEALWTVLLTSGLRIDEGLGLRWEDVDLGRGVMRVARTLNWLTGKGPTFARPRATKAGASI